MYMVPKVNKVEMMWTMEAIKEYLKSHCGVKKAPLAYIIHKTIAIQTIGNT